MKENAVLVVGGYGMVKRLYSTSCALDAISYRFLQATTACTQFQKLAPAPF